MFITLLAVTFVISLAVSVLVVWFFRGPIQKILDRIIREEVSREWTRYLIFAIFVVGISSGVRVWQLERYLPGSGAEGAKTLILTSERWVLEVYRTVIGTLQGIAWMLLVFFIFALIAYVAVRALEWKRSESR